jgi:hypothetical protein
MNGGKIKNMKNMKNKKKDKKADKERLRELASKGITILLEKITEIYMQLRLLTNEVNELKKIKNEGLYKEPKKEPQKNLPKCPECKKPNKRKRAKFCSHKCYQRSWSKANKDNVPVNVEPVKVNDYEY